MSSQDANLEITTDANIEQPKKSSKKEPCGLEKIHQTNPVLYGIIVAIIVIVVLSIAGPIVGITIPIAIAGGVIDTMSHKNKHKNKHKHGSKTIVTHLTTAVN
jgi:hypothetical protein